MLLDLLSRAYDEMKVDQRDVVFGKYVRELPPEPVEGESLLRQIEVFKERSLAGFYYAPFAINSKNWTHIPEETKEWFEEMGDYLKASCQLTKQGDHLHAVACFELLYELIEAVDSGEEIVFAEELGSWMIPIREKDFLADYMTSMAATMTPDQRSTNASQARLSPLMQALRSTSMPVALVRALRAILIGREAFECQ